MKTLKKISIVLFSVSLLLLIGYLGYDLGRTSKIKKTTSDTDGSDQALDVPEDLDNPAILDDQGDLDNQGNLDHQDDLSNPNNSLDDVDGLDDVTDNDNLTEKEIPRSQITLAFAGDILFADSSVPINKYDSIGKGVDGILSANLISKMLSADIMMLNNEFAYSTRGTKIPDKTYTFRAHPDRVNILHEMGVDIVSLANNHALDYGSDALLDTFDTLDKAGINYVGAGDTMDRAKAAIYHTVEDKTIAFLSASRVIYAMDWYATDTRPGMLGTYDPAILIEEIKEAKTLSDYIVVYVHWGVESDQMPQEYQRTLAKQYIDAGADAVIGAHPHVMQGFEYYKGKPIVYSLGNFWFSSYKRESGLLEIILEPDGSVNMKILPVMTGDCYTYLLEDEQEIEKYYEYMQSISFGISIDGDGLISQDTP